MEALACYNSSDDEDEAAATYIEQEKSRKGKQVIVPVNNIASSSTVINPDILEECSSSNASIPATAVNEKMSNLIAMGFSPDEALDALETHDEGTSMEEIVTFLTSTTSKETAEPSKVKLLMSFKYPRVKAEEAVKACGEDVDIGVLIQYIDDYMDKSPLEHLEELGYPEDRAKQAIQSCGDVPLDVIIDFLEGPNGNRETGKTRNAEPTKFPKKRAPATNLMNTKNKMVRSTPEEFHHLGDMTGFGLPGMPQTIRELTAKQKSRPYFYFENKANVPPRHLEEISRALDNIEPEFVNTKHFSVVSLPRAYVHNLPIGNRYMPERDPPMPKTIADFLPHTVSFIPVWDTRQKLGEQNLGFTPKVAKKIEQYLKSGIPSEGQKREILADCKLWNLVWTGPEVCSPLEFHELENMLGYPKDHTRGGFVQKDRRPMFGTAYHVDMVAYHMSALKPEFPNGIRVLSLFSGIGGAEIALDRIGIPLKFVVSVETKASSMTVLDRWWTLSKQKGKHIKISDVGELDRRKLEALVKEYGGFDLVIGNNGETGGTGVYLFARILGDIRSIMDGT